MFAFAGKQLEYGKRETVEGWARLVDGSLFLVDLDAVDLNSLMDADGSVSWELVPRILVSDQRIAFALRNILPATAGIRSPFCEKIFATGVLSFDKRPIMEVQEIRARDWRDPRPSIHYLDVDLDTDVLDALKAEDEILLREMERDGLWENLPACR